MKKWGILVTGFYFLTILVLVIPATLWVVVPRELHEGFLENVRQGWAPWLWLVLIVAGQAMLLFVSVDTSFAKVKTRRHVLFSIGTVAFTTSVLTWFGASSILLAVSEKDSSRWDFLLGAAWPMIALWLFWGGVFYLYSRERFLSVNKVVGWLLKGSVLELLVVVPCHVFVRRRGDCSAPFVTGYGIATGIAVMLMSFGPSVLFLYMRRLRQYRDVHSTTV